MPRMIDHDRGNATHWDEVLLPEPVYGHGEVTAEEREATALAYDGAVMGWWPQLSTTGKLPRGERAKVLDAAHAWLSENATGPWSWTEAWENHGHSLETRVYAERQPDQLAFLDAFPDVFEHRPDDGFQLVSMAILRGVLPVPTALEDFGRWRTDHQGFRFLPAPDLDDGSCRLTFDHPAVEAAFVGRFGDAFRVEVPGQPATYVGPFRGARRGDDVLVWLDAHAGVGDVVEKPGSYACVARYADVAAELERDWGRAFSNGAEPGVYVAKERPKLPVRVVPADFLAYLRGEADGYAAPHLPDALRRFTERPSGPVPR